MIVFLLMIHWKLATQIAYFVKITRDGGILIIGTHAQNFIIDGNYDLVVIYKQNRKAC